MNYDVLSFSNVTDENVGKGAVGLESVVRTRMSGGS
jgi:hypothetical protein